MRGIVDFDYLWAGYVSAGIRELITYNPDSSKYLEMVFDLNRACDRMHMENIDGERLGFYMSLQELQEDIDEIRYRYSIACKNHPDTLLQLKLKT